MSFLKTVLVILFSLALIGSQAVFASNGAVSGAFSKQEGKGCSCSMKGCCLQQSSEVPAEPLASIPVSSSVQPHLFVAAVCTILLQQSITAHERVVVATHSSPSVPAVPLFMRNCTFLI